MLSVKDTSDSVKRSEVLNDGMRRVTIDDGLKEEELSSELWVDVIASNVIGRRCIMSTPFGKIEMVYADYTASGRFLAFIEDFMQKVVAPTYGNTHTDASMTGAQTSRLREEARDIIRDALHAPKEEYAVLFTGTGATGAIEKLVNVLGLIIPEYIQKNWKVNKLIHKKKRPVVFISHFEHHSNELIWRESIVECVIIREGEDGTPDLAHLEKNLNEYVKRKVPLIGSFSAGSNVTGIRSPVREITKLLHKFGAYSFFDYAGVGAYVSIDMSCGGGDEGIDAIFLSPHKFIGGPGSAGVLVARHKLFNNAFGVKTTNASTPGGGTVVYVTRDDHTYSKNTEAREDAGTPAILQSIRAGLVFKVKEMVGAKKIEELEHNHINAVLKRWSIHPMISLLGANRTAYFDVYRRVSIFSFNILSPYDVRYSKSSTGIVLASKMKRYTLQNDPPSASTIPLHHNFVATILNDVYGIQGRGGCSCAGPYGSELLGLSNMNVDTLKSIIVDHEYEVFKPGWARVNFNYFIDQMETDFIIEAVEQIAIHGWKLLPLYIIDLKSAQFVNRSRVNVSPPAPYSIHDVCAFAIDKDKSIIAAPKHIRSKKTKADYKNVLRDAMKIYNQKIEKCNDLQDFTTDFSMSSHLGNIWWLLPSEVARCV